jgi:hypothetical protein
MNWHLAKLAAIPHWRFLARWQQRHVVENRRRECLDVVDSTFVLVFVRSNPGCSAADIKGRSGVRRWRPALRHLVRQGQVTASGWPRRYTSEKPR